MDGSKLPFVTMVSVRATGAGQIPQQAMASQGCGSAPKPSVAVCVLTTFDLDEYVHAALRAGASGFLLKDAQPTDLLAAVHQVAQGESVLAPTLVRRLIAAYVETPTTSSRPAWLDSLTPREIEVLVAVARGLSNAEIGNALYMSAATAKTHVGRLLTKLNARDRTHLVIAAYEAGLISRA
jgi:DNA-binding NarL/FixJ family response regulator